MQFLLSLNIIGIVFVSGILSAIYFFTNYDSGELWKTKTKEAQQKIIATEKKITQQKEELQKTVEFDNSVKVMGKELDYFLTYIPESLTTLHIFEDLTSVSKMSGVEIVSMSNSKQSGSTAKFYQSMAVNLSLKGTFSNFLIFLSQLTHLKKFITVQSVSLSPANDRKNQAVSTPIILAKINLVGFRYLKDSALQDGLKK